MYNSQTKTKSDTIVYMDSRDSLLTSGGDAKITHVLKEPIVKRDNEMIITSLYNLQVPYSFYNITPHNNTLCFQYGTTLCMYTPSIMGFHGIYGLDGPSHYNDDFPNKIIYIIV